MADEYLNKAGAQVLAGKIKENTQYGETLTAILAKDHATSLRLYATLSDRPSAIDVANGVLLAVGERCFVVATGKYYKVTAVDNETNAITWEETDALFGSGGGSGVVDEVAGHTFLWYTHQTDLPSTTQGAIVTGTRAWVYDNNNIYIATVTDDAVTWAQDGSLHLANGTDYLHGTASANNLDITSYGK